MTPAPFGQTDKLLHGQESHYPGQHPQANDHVLHVIVVVVVIIMVMVAMVMVVMVMVSVVVFPVAVVMRRDGVGDEVEEGISEETPRGEAEQDLEEGGVVLSVLQGDAEEDEEGGGTDECRGDKPVGPEFPGALEGGGELQDEPPGRVL